MKKTYKKADIYCSQTSHKSATAARTNAGEGDGQTEKGLNGTNLKKLSFFSELLVIQYNKETQFE